MARKLVFFILGVVLLSSAWIGVTSAVKNSQEISYKESLPLKFGLIQSKWERLLNFSPVVNGALKKPADFVFFMDVVELGLMSSKLSPGLVDDHYHQLKKAYLDAGRKSAFFTAQLENSKKYLVRALIKGEKLELVGFSLDVVLNYLGNGLEKNEWFLIDKKSRVLAASESAYVGRSYTAGSNLAKFKFEQNGHSFSFSMVKPQPISMAFVRFFGLLGIFLISSALFIYTNGMGLFGEEQSKDFLAVSNKSFDQIDANVEKQGGEYLDAPVVQESYAKADIFDEEDIADDVRMVDLNSSSAKLVEESANANLNYTEFLMDNPVLGSDSKTPLQSSVNVKAPVEPLEVKGVESEDWVKLAEELSANIDRFTKNIQTKKKTEDDLDA